MGPPWNPYDQDGWNRWQRQQWRYVIFIVVLLATAVCLVVFAPEIVELFKSWREE